jgi:hypothetical protein
VGEASAGESPETVRPNGARSLVASAAYPGLGQLLNGAEVKAAVIGAAEAFLIARLVLEDRRTRNSFRRYLETGESRYFRDYSDHFDRRQTFVWWALAAVLYGLADAYVDAHLVGFDERPPLIGGVSFPGDEGVARGIRFGIALEF